MNIKYLNKLFKSQLGFSLVEVMIGGSLLAGVGLAGAYIFKEQKIGQKKIDHDEILSSFHLSLSKQLSIKKNCNATLSAAYGLDIATNSVLTELNICDQPTCTDVDIDAGDITAGMKVKIANVYTGAEAGWIDGYPNVAATTRIWRISNIIVAEGTNSTGSVRLRITYEKNPNLPNPKTVSKDLLLSVRFESGGFVECIDQAESSLNNLQKDLCEKFEAVGQIATWDDVEQRCILNNNVTNCPVGQAVRGIQSDGEVKCRPVGEGFDPDSYIDPGNSATPCAPPSKFQMTYDPDGQLRVQCAP